MKLYYLSAAVLAALTEAAHAGFGGMTGVDSAENTNHGSGRYGPEAVVCGFGSLAGYHIERAINKAKLRKQGVNEKGLDSRMLGGATGAIVGAAVTGLVVVFLKML